MDTANELIRAFDVACIFDKPTETIKAWARRGLLPGSVWVGNHAWFRKAEIELFIANGGSAGVATETERFAVVRHGGRGHAGSRPHTDRAPKPNGDQLARLVKPDPGVRDYSPERP